MASIHYFWRPCAEDLPNHFSTLSILAFKRVMNSSFADLSFFPESCRWLAYTGQLDDVSFVWYTLVSMFLYSLFVCQGSIIFGFLLIKLCM